MHLPSREGKVWTVGSPENGTLGHNDDGKFMQKANKVASPHLVHLPHMLHLNT